MEKLFYSEALFKDLEPLRTQYSPVVVLATTFVLVLNVQFKVDFQKKT